MPIRLPSCLAWSVLLACGALIAAPPVAAGSGLAPPDAAPGTCWHAEQTPAVIETVTEHRQEAPARHDAEGRLIAPARYRSVSLQRVLRERQTTWWRIPCPLETGPGFTAALQRALAARGFHSGPVTGTPDDETLAAVRAYQRARGAPAPVLTRDSAEALGLVIAEIPAGDG